MLVLYQAFLPFGAEPDAQSKFRNGEQETLLNKQYVGSTNRAPPTARTSLEDLNTMEMLCRPNFWLLFLSVLMGMGAGLMTINNVSGIVGSLDPSEPVSVYVTIIGASHTLVLTLVNRCRAWYLEMSCVSTSDVRCCQCRCVELLGANDRWGHGR